MLELRLHPFLVNHRGTRGVRKTFYLAGCTVIGKRRRMTNTVLRMQTSSGLRDQKPKCSTRFGNKISHLSSTRVANGQPSRVASVHQVGSKDQ